MWTCASETGTTERSTRDGQFVSRMPYGRDVSNTHPDLFLSMILGATART
jgi:hypothetical protein